MPAYPTHYVPQIGSLRRPLIMWFIVAAGSVAVMSLIIGAPLALKSGNTFLGQAIYGAFSYVCHQLPERSFYIAAYPFSVCARCTGIYAGFTLATVVYPLVRSLRQIEAPPRTWLFIAAAPLAIDVAVNFFGIWANTHSSRFVTGVLLGAAAVFYVMPGLMDLSLRQWHSTRKATGLETSNRVSPSEVFPTNVAAAPSDYSAPDRRI